MQIVKVGFKDIWLYPNGDSLAEKLLDNDSVINELENAKAVLMDENKESNGELFINNQITSEEELEYAIAKNSEYYYAIFVIDYLAEIVNNELKNYNMSNDKFKNYKPKDDADLYEYNFGEIKLAWTDDNFSSFNDERLYEIVKEYFKEHISEWLDEAINTAEKGYILDGSSVEIPNKKEFYLDLVDFDGDYYSESFSI